MKESFFHESDQWIDWTGPQNRSEWFVRIGASASRVSMSSLNWLLWTRSTRSEDRWVNHLEWTEDLTNGSEGKLKVNQKKKNVSRKISNKMPCKNDCKTLNDIAWLWRYVQINNNKKKLFFEMSCLKEPIRGNESTVHISYYTLL